MKYFNTNEFDDFSKMDTEFIEWLNDLRERYGHPIKINSSYRNPDRNNSVNGVDNSAHTEIPCKAVDIHCPNSLNRFNLVQLALKMGCKRIGIGSNFIHVDFSTIRPNPRIWTYYK